MSLKREISNPKDNTKLKENQKLLIIQKIKLILIEKHLKKSAINFVFHNTLLCQKTHIRIHKLIDDLLKLKTYINKLSKTGRIKVKIEDMIFLMEIVENLLNYNTGTTIGFIKYNESNTDNKLKILIKNL